jgi:hypothetical protein
MHISITHEEKSHGLLKKAHSVEVKVHVRFTDHEHRLIAKYNLGHRIVANKPRSSIVLKRLGHQADDPAMFLLPLSFLTENETHTYDCDNRVQAERYEHEIREGLVTLKNYIDKVEGQDGSRR